MRRGGEHAIKHGHSRAEVVRREVAIPHRHGDGLVAERLLNLLQRPAALDEPGRERMPEVVEPEAFDAGGVKCCLPGAAERIPVATTEHVPVGLWRPAAR